MRILSKIQAVYILFSFYSKKEEQPATRLTPSPSTIVFFLTHIYILSWSLTGFISSASHVSYIFYYNVESSL